jgi:hypothetical protein
VAAPENTLMPNLNFRVFSSLALEPIAKPKKLTIDNWQWTMAEAAQAPRCIYVL